MKIFIIILILGFNFLPRELLACSCIGSREVKEEIRQSDAVVTGEIISKNLIKLVDSTAIKIFSNTTTNTTGFPYAIMVAKYELVISSLYKGKFKADTIEVYTGLGNGDCGVEFEIGRKYIVYGQKGTYFGQTNNNWPFPKGKNITWTDICSRTTVVNKNEITEIERYRKKK